MRLIFPKLLKTHIEKMSDFRLSMIFMKKNELGHALHDVDENKGESSLCGLGVCGWRERHIPTVTLYPAFSRVMHPGEAAR